MAANTGYTAVSLFSGCGGSDLGLQLAGITPVWANDRFQVTCDLYVKVTGLKHIVCQDVSKIVAFPKADILVGCYPCQGYSQGGRRDSTDGINYLYRHFDRALRQIKPVAFIVENVDGMQFSQNEPLLRAQLTRFRLAGYCVSLKRLDAKDFGLAQERRRLFLVGIRSQERKQFEFPSPIHGNSPGLKPFSTLKSAIWHLRDAPVGSYCDEPFHWYYLSRNRRREWNEPAACVVAHWRHAALHPDSPPLRKLGPDAWEFVGNDADARRLSYLECAALQGFPDPSAFSVGSVRQRFRAIGNAVPPPLFATVASSLARQLRARAAKKSLRSLASTKSSR